MIRQMNTESTVILVSNSRDFATDYIVAELRSRQIAYVRIDLDLASDDALVLDVNNLTLKIESPQGRLFLSEQSIGGIFYRAPTHLSESSGLRYSSLEQLRRHQWAAFARSLMVFDSVNWVNRPDRTYLAESKPYQLAVAKRLGWRILPTLITNADIPAQWQPNDRHLAVKALDTFFTQTESGDIFLYTNRVERDCLTGQSLSAMPCIVQQYLDQKRDIRVTVVDNECMAAFVLQDGQGVSGDWRVAKESVEYELCVLPKEISDLCLKMVSCLGLRFGAIDLMLSGDEYYFVEINPTGEWAWLVDGLRFPIPELIADALVGVLA